jgi:biofilm PGA synthesis protein PgaA
MRLFIQASKWGHRWCGPEVLLNPRCVAKSWWRTAIFCISVFGSAVPVAHAAIDNTAYDALIKEARSGDTAPVLDYLRHVDLSGPVASRYVNDWIAVASWAGRDEEVADVYARWSSGLVLSASAHAIAGSALRKLRRWNSSIQAYQRALSIQPASIPFHIGLIHVFADAGKDDEALADARRLLAAAPLDPERLLALAYVHTAARRYFAALEEVTRARTIAPTSLPVEKAYVEALQSAGLPTEALSRTQRDPDNVSAVEKRRLRADAAAELVRIAYTPATTEDERFKAADAALAAYHAMLQDWSQFKDPTVMQQVVRIRIDRLGALAARARMQETVAEYESLRKEKVVVPDYALRWVAGAYLNQRRPAVAKELYSEVLAHDSANSEFIADDSSGLFYSLSELEQKTEASQFADKLAVNLAPTDRVLGSTIRAPSDDWASAQELAAQGHSYADDTPAAQRRLQALVALAPGNSSLHTTLAGVYLARSWPRRAEEELKVTEAMAPHSLSLELQQGFTALDLQEWEQAEILAVDTAARFPEILQVRRLGRLVEVQNKAELRVSSYRDLSADSPVTGNADYGIDTVLYSAPIQRNWRVFGGVGWSAGQFPEGMGHDRIQRGGAEWRSRDNTIEAEISNHDFGYGNRLGLRLDAAHDLSDQWQLSAGLEKFSRDTPLRALNSNVTADSAAISARWRRSDRSEWSLALGTLQFSDGNSRLAATLLGRQRIFTAPRFTADLALETSAAHGKRQDVSYYNPAAEYTIAPRIDLSHIIYRRYETEWRQQLQLGTGVYSERGFGGGAIYFIGYSQRLRLNDVFEAGLGISVTRRPYDGVRQRIVRGTLELSARF